MNKKLVVIGGDAAGMSAASKVRREQPGMEIVVFERGPHTSYAACGIPYYIGKLVDSPGSLVAREPEEFRKKYNIDVRILHEVVKIDPSCKTVRVRDLRSEREFDESWDQLLIATGAAPVKPAVEGIDTTGVFTLSTLQSGLDLFEYIKKFSPRKALVAGGGYIGIEMAEVLLERGMKVTLADMAPQVMVTLDDDMAMLVSGFMEKEGVILYLGEKVSGIDKSESGRVSRVITTQRTIETDLVVLGTGVRPNSSLAGKAGIKLGAANAISVDKRQRTSADNIWAAGDCAESFHLVKRQQVFVPLGTVANKQGLVAGINISGGEIEFPGVLGTAITRFRELEISRTGLSEKEAKEMGIKYRVNKIDSSTISHYFPGAGKITVKLVAEDGTGRLLGGQIAGMTGAGKRIDSIATAITANMTLQHLVDLDLAYAPPFSPVWDPVQIAARTMV